jgi:hypothetical protein
MREMMAVVHFPGARPLPFRPFAAAGFSTFGVFGVAATPASSITSPANVPWSTRSTPPGSASPTAVTVASRP